MRGCRETGQPSYSSRLELRAYSAVGRRVDQSRERQRVVSSAQSIVWRGESLFWGRMETGLAWEKRY